MRLISEINVPRETILIRVDFNIPMINGIITDATRIYKTIPTIKYLLENNAKIIIISHYGRPKGKFVSEMSLKPIAIELSKILGKEIEFISDILSDETKSKATNLKSGEILFLENLRFYAAEELNDSEFAKALASLASIYVNDAFSCSHRAHASISAITKFLPSYAGLLLSSEVAMLDKYLSNPEGPISAIIGGSKISTKIDLLYSLIKNADNIMIGGGMANNFLKSQNIDIGNSLFEPGMIEKSKDILRLAKDNNCNIILPIDAAISTNLQDITNVKIVDINNVPPDYSIFDTGPKTIDLFYENIKNSKTIIWNGPLGAFEYKPFNLGTTNLAHKITSLDGVISIAGGGDIIAALTAANVIDNFTYYSTAGGAFLEWLEFKWDSKGELPGIKALSYLI